MLEPFESFLSEVVLQMQHNKQDKHKLQNHIKKLATLTGVLRYMCSVSRLQNHGTAQQRGLRNGADFRGASFACTGGQPAKGTHYLGIN